MTVVRKKSKKSSTADLRSAMTKLIYLLQGQKEDEAVADLRIALSDIEKYQVESAEFQAALKLINEAFEGEHELNAYTYKRDKEDQWTEVEELYLASTSVLNLVRRLLNTQVNKKCELRQQSLRLAFCCTAQPFTTAIVYWVLATPPLQVFHGSGLTKAIQSLAFQHTGYLAWVGLEIIQVTPSLKSRSHR